MFNTLIFNKLCSNKQSDSVLHSAHKAFKAYCLNMRTGCENYTAEMVFEEFYLFRTVKSVGFFFSLSPVFPHIGHFFPALCCCPACFLCLSVYLTSP